MKVICGRKTTTLILGIIILLGILFVGQNTQASSIKRGDLIQSTSGGSVYLINAGKRNPIHSAEVFKIRNYKWSQVKKVSQSQVNAFPKGALVTYYNNTLLRAEGKSTVWVIQNGRRYYIPSASVFSSLGYKWGQIKDIPAEKLNKIDSRGSISEIRSKIDKSTNKTY